MIFNQPTYLSPLISAPKINSSVLWNLAYLFSGLAVVYVVAIFFYRNKISFKSTKVMQRKKELSPMISEFIFYENNATKDEKHLYIKLKIEIRELIKNDFNRKVLSEVLLDLKKDVSGESQERLCKLYKDLNLHLEAVKKLKSWQWQVVSKAITDLTKMQVNEAYSLLTRFLNDRRTTIRRQAEIAVVSLNKEGINYFLDTTKYKISEWQQLKILDVIRNQKDYTPPRFKAWLTSSNSYVVLFALRLIKYYNQNDANTSLIELIKHKNNQIKQEAIGCIKEFHVVQALGVLEAVFWKSTTDIKISILDAIASLGDNESIRFLKSIERKETNFYVKSKAISSINTLKPGSIIPFEGIEDTANYSIPDDLPITTPISKKVQKTVSSEPIRVSDTAKEVAASFSTASKPSVQKTTVNLDFIPIVTNTTKEEVDKSPITLDAVKELTVLFEIVAAKPESEKPKKQIITEITTKDLAFLPIVVASNKEEEYQKKAVQTPKTISVNEIEVSFEEISIPIKRNIKDIEVVVDADFITLPVAKVISYSHYSSPKILNITVCSTEVSIEKTPNKILHDIIVNEPHFLDAGKTVSEEDGMDITSNALTESPPINEIMTPEQEKEFKKLINDLVNFENKEEIDDLVNEIEKSPLLEFENEIIDISFMPIVAKEEDTEEPINTKDQVNIPKSQFSNELLETVKIADESSELAMKELIKNLKEMGDHRELPLLNEMLDSNKYQSIHTSIKQLIHQFSIEAIESLEFKKVKKEEHTNQLKPFNVFADLFKTSDTESKLILLSEIAAIGDADDIDFLQSLLQDTNPAIQRKAIVVLKELKERLDIFEAIDTNATKTNPKISVENSLNSIPKEVLAVESNKNENTNNENDIFNLNFNITPKEDISISKKEHSKPENSSLSFLNQVYEFSNNLINRLNG